MASGPMILKCSHCGGMMKVDEAKIPANRRFKVRCPHCEQIDVVTHQSFIPEPPRRAPQAPAAEQPIPRETKPSSRGSATSSAVQRSIGDIHFPADTGDVELSERKFLSRKTRLICWAVGSLLWVALFALLVNLVLPGPYGGRPVTGLPPQEDTASAPEGSSLPQPVGKGMQKSPASR
jgi:predicted Zn finger-like uncharacterized protein